MARGGKGRQYTEEFKESAVDLALSDERSIGEVSESLGISYKTLHNWVVKRKALEQPKQHSSDEGLEAELKRLRKENKTLKQERDILKKATAYFAKDAM